MPSNIIIAGSIRRRNKISAGFALRFVDYIGGVTLRLPNRQIKFLAKFFDYMEVHSTCVTGRSSITHWGKDVSTKKSQPQNT